jgi:quercetin dioxygenase-like cupin family protein
VTETHNTTGTDRRESHELAGDLLHFELQQEVAGLRKDLGRASGGRTAKTLTKAGGLRAILVVIESGVTLEPQAVAGASTLQVLDGRVRVSAGGVVQEVRAGELVVLSQNLREPVEALEAAAFILTVAWPEGAGAWEEEASRGQL